MKLPATKADAHGRDLVIREKTKKLFRMPGYTSSKAAIEGLTCSLARDLGQHKIRVNCVVPGWIMTERSESLWLTPAIEKELLDKQCLKEKLYPEDVTRMVLWLAADDSRLCTNHMYIIDAGWL